jgi:hypothetical protein
VPKKSPPELQRDFSEMNSGKIVSLVLKKRLAIRTVALSGDVNSDASSVNRRIVTSTSTP